MRSLFSLVTSPVSLLLIFGWPLMERKRGILRGVSMTFPKSTTVTRKTRKPRGPWCLSLLSFEKANNQDILRGNFQNDFQNFFRKSFGKSYSFFQIRRKRKVIAQLRFEPATDVMLGKCTTTALNYSYELLPA